jgi:hypothetical protein
VGATWRLARPVGTPTRRSWQSCMFRRLSEGAGAACSPVRAAGGVRGRFRGVGRGEGVQGRAWGGFSGSPAMPDVGEGVRSVRLGCL